MAHTKLKHAQRARLEFLDALFFWEGRANRSDLIERFGISPAQAALDFKAYLAQMRATELSYDPALKQYLRGPSFKPRSDPPGLEDWIRLSAAHVDFEAVPTLERQGDLRVHASLYRAIRDSLSVEIHYQSMTTGRPQLRWIAPTRFASNGVRIHVRAYCFKNAEFRDFIPARINPDGSFRNSRQDDELPEDSDWQKWVVYTLVPHRRLTPEQKAAVRKEYGFAGATLKVRIRKALAFYAPRQWGLDQEKPRLEIEKIEERDALAEQAVEHASSAGRS